MTGLSWVFTTLPLAGVGFVFQQSNLSGKVIVVLLWVGSMVAWTLMVTKFRELQMSRRASERFLKAYREASHPVAMFIHEKVDPNAGPLHRIYRQACQSLGAAIDTGTGPGFDLFRDGHPLQVRERHMRAVRNAVDRTVADQALLLENHMGVLATAASTAPFLGLLGTVWGVMDSFGSMSTGGSALLSDVAPGISGALMTTVIGLLVALPSSIGYNMLSDRIRWLVVKMDNFAQELVSDFEQLEIDD